MNRPPSAAAPIGIFDSGVGGLTVAHAILDQLPDEELRYVGDTAHSPYGPKPIAEIRRHAHQWPADPRARAGPSRAAAGPLRRLGRRFLGPVIGQVEGIAGYRGEPDDVLTSR
jgi:hypothetical protein